MSIQATIKFPSVKKLTFYGGKNEEKQDFTNATVRNTPSSVRYVSKVKKIMTISSSESDGDSDCSDSENSKRRTRGSKVVATKTITRTSRRRRQVSISNEGNFLVYFFFLF